MISFAKTLHPENNIFGNDVVDLAEAILEGEKSESFMNRVFSQEEISFYRDAGQERIWAGWACKEAAYKALASVMPALPFVWSRFVVSENLNEVCYENHCLICSVEITGGRIYALCESVWENGLATASAFGVHSRIDLIDEISAIHPSDATPVLEDLDPVGLPDLEEGTPGHPSVDFGIVQNQRFGKIIPYCDLTGLAMINRDSAAVRLLALREMASLMGIEPDRLSVSSPGSKNAPLIYLDGREFVRASFSHHGRFAAVAFMLPDEQ